MSVHSSSDSPKSHWGQLFVAFVFAIAAGIGGRVFELGAVLPVKFTAAEFGIAKALYCTSWCVGIFIAARLVDIMLWEGFVRRRTGLRVPGLLRQLGVVILTIVGGVGMLSTVFGIPVSALMTASGALGIVVGLAFKDMLSDFFSGIVLNLEQPFWLDEWICVGSGSEATVGCVKEISWRSTRLETSEKNLVVVRNANFLTSKLVNFSRPSLGAEYQVEVCIDFSIDPALVKTVFEAATSESATHPLILREPPPRHYLKCINSDGLLYVVTFSIDLKRCSRKAARDVILSAVTRHLRFAGIEPASSKEQVLMGRLEAPARYTGSFTNQSLRMLQQIEFLRSMTDEELADLAGKIRVQKRSAGEAVVRVGEPGSSMFVVISGHLEVSVKANGSDDLIRVATLGPGDFFGEMSLLTGETRTATVAAIVASVLFEITHENAAELFESRPELADELSRVAADRKLRSEAAAASSRPAGEVAQRRDSLVASISQGIAKFFSRNR